MFQQMQAPQPMYTDPRFMGMLPHQVFSGRQMLQGIAGGGPSAAMVMPQQAPQTGAQGGAMNPYAAMLQQEAGPASGNVNEMDPSGKKKKKKTGAQSSQSGPQQTQASMGGGPNDLGQAISKLIVQWLNSGGLKMDGGQGMQT